MRGLEEIFDEIDQIDDMELLNKLDRGTRDAEFVKTFWEQRKLALTGETEEIRKKARIKCRIIAKMYNASIPITKRVNRFTTPHGLTGIHISAYGRIGKGCTIFQHAVIGSNTLSDSKNQGFPTIGDNVFIGAGAMVIGNVHIGNNVRIGANAIVTKDVPDNCIVVSSGLRVIQSTEPLNNKFVLAENYKKQIAEK